MRPGEIRLLDKAFYGLRNAPFLFIEQFTDIVMKHGYACTSAESILIRTPINEPKEAMGHHMDDVLSTAMGVKAQESIERIKPHLKMGPITTLPVGKTGRQTYVGMQLDRSPEGMEVHQGDYVKAMVLEPLTQKLAIVDSSTIKAPEPEEVDLPYKPGP